MIHTRPIRNVNIPRVNMDDPYVYMAVQHLYRSLRHVSRFTRHGKKSIQPINRHMPHVNRGMSRVKRANHVHLRRQCHAPPHQQKQQTRQQQSERGYVGMPMLHLSNLPYSVTYKELRDFFSKFGKIAWLYLPRYPDNGNLNKGYGLLRFRTIKSTGVCYHAMRNALQRIGGRYIFVDFADKYKPPPEERQCVRQLYVSNYPLDKTDSDLKTLFSQLGEVSWAHLFNDDKGNHIGKGQVSYVDSNVAFYAEKHFNGEIVASEGGYIPVSEIVAGRRIHVRLTREFRAIDEKSGECKHSDFTKRTPSITTASTDSLENNGMPQ